MLDGFPSGLISLRDAIQIANTSSNPTTITFDPKVFNQAETITLNGTALELTNTAASTTVIGPAATVTVSGNHLSGVLKIDVGVTASISVITLANGNASPDGGGIDNRGSMTLSNVNIISNSATADGGGIESDAPGSATMTNVNITDNSTSGNGGGFFNNGAANLTDVTLSQNTAGSDGGAIFNSFNSLTTLSLSNVTISGNSAVEGGGINNTSEMGLNDVAISSNTASGDGGGIYNAQQSDEATACTATLNDVTISGNIGVLTGGIYNAASITINSSTLSDDTSTGNNAGGLYSVGDVTLVNVTVANNLGGGIGIVSGMANLFDITVSRNDLYGSNDSVADGVVAASGVSVTIANSIVAGNFASSGQNPDLEGAFNSEGFNLIGAIDGSTGWQSTDITGTIADLADPDLSPLDNNGGPTQTMVPMTGSPALGAGADSLIPAGTTTDQRGLPRTRNGTVDIGAVELQMGSNAASPSKLVFSQTPNTFSATDMFSTSVSVVDASGSPVTDDDSSINVSIASDSSGAQLEGTFTEPVFDGVAAFSNISLSIGEYTLEAGDAEDQLTATSSSFTVIPSVSSLATISNDVYNAGSQGVGAAFTDTQLSGMDSNNAGYLAKAYVPSGVPLSTKPSEIVIAIRGTVLNPLFHPLETFANIAADVSFGGTTATALLASEVSDAVAFINTIAGMTIYQNVPIVLTGHSLGGAVAQLIGAYSGLPTITFNAPGAAQLLGSLNSQLSQMIPSNVNSSVNTNYRIFGDQISLFGTPFSQTITLPDPSGTTFSSALSYLTQPAFATLDDLDTFYSLHSMATVIAQINKSPVSDQGEPDAAAILETFVMPASSAIPLLGSFIDRFQFTVASGVAILLDPAAGSDFVFTGQTGSPDIGSIILPPLPGVDSYDLRYQTEGSPWSPFQVLQPGAQYNFGPNVDSVEFKPLGPDGEGLSTPSSFLLGASFTSNGTFSGTLDATGVMADPTGTDASDVALVSSVATPSYGDSITFTATISSPFAQATLPAGTVSFLDAHGDTLGTCSIQTNDTAVFSTSALPAGTDSLVAIYSGDGLYSQSISPAVTETVSAKPPSSIVPTLGKIVLPASAVAGQKLRASVPVFITNTGSKLTGIYTINIFVGTNSILDGNQVLVSTLSRKMSLAAEKRGAFSFDLKPLPGTLGDGTYDLFVQVIDPTGLSNIVVSSRTVQVSAPYVALAAMAELVMPAIINSGKFGSTTITLTNYGTVSAIGLITLSLSPSTDGVTALSIPLASISRHVVINPSRSIRVAIRFRITATLDAGVYFSLVTIVFEGTTTTAVSPSFEVQ